MIAYTKDKDELDLLITVCIIRDEKVAVVHDGSPDLYFQKYDKLVKWDANKPEEIPIRGYRPDSLIIANVDNIKDKDVVNSIVLGFYSVMRDPIAEVKKKAWQKIEKLDQ